MNTNDIIAKTALEVLPLFKAATISGNETVKQQVALNETREGTYTNMVKAAVIVYRTATSEGEKAEPAELSAAMKELWEGFKEDIRNNEDGIAAELGCKLGKGKNGKPGKYLVPGPQSTAASKLIEAFAFAVPVIEAGTDAKYRPARKFRQIADDLQAAKKKRELARLGTQAQLLDKRLTELRDVTGKYGERFKQIAKSGDWCERATDALTAAIEACLPFIMEVEKASAEAKPETAAETDAGETVAAEAEAKPVRKRTRKAS